jgi:quinol monooxygenase YgiN
MWAQLITTRLKAGKEDQLPKLYAQLQAAEQPGTGLIRSTAMQDQKDPSRIYMLVMFESEEKARARENDPRRVEGLQVARETMAEIFADPPVFVDLVVVEETTP